MALRTLEEADVKHKTVLVRVDFNVPILEDLTVGNNTRLEESMETINYLINHKARVVLISHLGRPDGKNGRKDHKFSLKPVAKELSRLLDMPVGMADDCVGKSVEKEVKALKDGQVLLLENTRFHPEDSENDNEFAKKLAKLADVYVNDAFGTCHRKHASVERVAELLPSYAGFLLQREIKFLSKVLINPNRPVCVMVGGSKIETKLPLLSSFFDKTETILVGGAIANTFLAAAGYNIGKSLHEEDKIELAREIMLQAEKHKVRFVLPKDVVVASEISEQAVSLNIPVEDVEGDMKIFDLGKWTTEHYIEILMKTGMLIWNGPMGVFECSKFSHGTELIVHALAGNKKVETILGGGDTLDALRAFNVRRTEFTHVSTGGGAMLKFLSGAKLPGIEVLEK